MTPQERANKSAAAMWLGDEASKFLGIRIDKVSPGRAVLSMEIRDEHLNGHKICHGGFVFTLADSAFAFACNSYNQLAVAQHNFISFVQPAKKGETLTATAAEVSKSGRSGIYDVAVKNQKGEVVAEFRGCSRDIPGTHFQEDQA